MNLIVKEIGAVFMEEMIQTYQLGLWFGLWGVTCPASTMRLKSAKGGIWVGRPEGNEAEPVVLNMVAPKNYENKVQNVQIVQKVQFRVRAP